MPNLDFEGHNTLYATHGMHSYAAKCPPQLVRYGLHYYSKPGDRVLDPMAGSGTTLVEARLMGRSAVGYDIDPLACLIAQVKTRLIADSEIATAVKLVIDRVVKDRTQLQSSHLSTALLQRSSPPEFLNRDYWFGPEVAETLALLSAHIREADLRQPVRDFLWVGFSSLILAKNSVANARDIIHSRHHFKSQPNPPDVLYKFQTRIERMRQQMADFREDCQPGTQAEVRFGDARKLKISAESIDLVFTSPPYATALDYTRAHFLAVAWMQDLLGFGLPEYRQRAGEYIGSERGSLPRTFEIDRRLADFPVTQGVLTALAQESKRHANLAQRYFLDMQQVMAGIGRVLKDGRHAIIVVCPSHIRKTDVPTHEVLVELGRSVDLRLKHQHLRTIDERKRVLPYMQSFGARMSTEYVLVFQKRT
jgi:DNA modification methylase